VLTTGYLSQEQRMRAVLGRLPQAPRCKFCHAPFEGIGGALVRTLLHKRPSQYNTNMCTVCEDFTREHVGGAEVEMGMLFADVRGSTTLAETMSASEFSRLIERFYRAASRVLIESDALIEKLMGDSVTGLYFPGFAGPGYVQRSIQAARELLRLTGHGHANGPWIPVGIGLHHGTAFAGAVGSGDGVVGFTALGDAVNMAARLASHAGTGEILISEQACAAAGVSADGLERRQLTLKGRSGTAAVRVIPVKGNSG
jgi:adenylate cyclase